MGNQLGGKEGNVSILDSDDNVESACDKMTLKQRIIGFLVCSVTGFTLSWMLTFLFIFGGLSIKSFGVMFSLCQILNITGSCFLSTPQGHIKAMKKKDRIIPSIVYIAMIILTLIIALATNIKGLVFLCVIVLTLAYYWYTISFIPMGKRILKKICKVCFEAQ